ncbi:MAG TPA: hypothetical protein DDZ60_13345 [Planktothrix sp. UBA10369]|jgi:hypothetical protein|nr:hypothetical protein [Planktothrix sp. UBA10369]
MDTEQIVESIKQIVYQKSGKYLKDIHVDILREVMILRSHLQMFIEKLGLKPRHEAIAEDGFILTFVNFTKSPAVL